MSSTINASSAGIVETADSSGILTIQTGGQTGIYIDTGFLFVPAQSDLPYNQL